MAGKNAKKATSTSSKILPNKLPEIKPELVTPSQLVRYNQTLYQDAQDPNADLEEYEALLEEQLLE